TLDQAGEEVERRHPLSTDRIGEHADQHSRQLHADGARDDPADPALGLGDAAGVDRDHLPESGARSRPSSPPGTAAGPPLTAAPPGRCGRPGRGDEELAAPGPAEDIEVYGPPLAVALVAHGRSRPGGPGADAVPAVMGALRASLLAF